jgi:hypothetical protein
MPSRATGIRCFLVAVAHDEARRSRRASSRLPTIKRSLRARERAYSRLRDAPFRSACNATRPCCRRKRRRGRGAFAGSGATGRIAGRGRRARMRSARGAWRSSRGAATASRPLRAHIAAVNAFRRRGRRIATWTTRVAGRPTVDFIVEAGCEREEHIRKQLTCPRKAIFGREDGGPSPRGLNDAARISRGSPPCTLPGSRTRLRTALVAGSRELWSRQARLFLTTDVENPRRMDLRSDRVPRRERRLRLDFIPADTRRRRASRAQRRSPGARRETRSMPPPRITPRAWSLGGIPDAFDGRGGEYAVTLVRAAARRERASSASSSSASRRPPAEPSSQRRSIRRKASESRLRPSRLSPARARAVSSRRVAKRVAHWRQIYRRRRAVRAQPPAIEDAREGWGRLARHGRGRGSCCAGRRAVMRPRAPGVGCA